MQRLETSLRLRQVDAAYRRAIATGPLWSFQPAGEPVQLGPVNAPRAATMAYPGPTRGFDSVLVDGRCLQHPDFADRGIGRYTAGFLTALAATCPAVAITIVLDDSLPAPRTGALSPSITTMYGFDSGTGRGASAFRNAVFLDPAPMTHEPSALDPAVSANGSPRMAIVYDFIPAQSPSLYLPSADHVASYTRRLSRLASFDSLLCISQSVADDCPTYLGAHCGSIDVLPLPNASLTSEHQPIAGMPSAFVFAAVGADRRKNLPGAVAAMAGLSHLGWAGDLVILSHMPDAHRLELNALAEACRLDPARIHAVAGLNDAEVAWLYTRASAVLVPSFGEGLSLPVLEAVEAGRPVVVSDIAPHRELLGDNEPLCDPQRPSMFARQLAQVLAHPDETTRRQHAAIERLRLARDFAALATRLLG